VSGARVRFQRPLLPPADAIEVYLARSRQARWWSNEGPCWHLLRDRLAAATGRDCIPVANATLGLMVAVAALCERGPREARSVLMPSFAFAASAQAAAWNGLRPVFLDVDPDHWHLDPAGLERALSERGPDVALVLALSSFGTPPPAAVRERWQAACAGAGVPLLVDSAAGFGAVAEDGCPIGGQGDAEVVSFHATKPVAAGEGGAVFCRDPAVAERVRRLANFDFDADRNAASARGINAKMCEPVAAIALAALDGMFKALAARREAAGEILARVPSDFSSQLGCERSTWQFVPLRAPSARVRDEIMARACDDVELRTYYEPLHGMPAFAKCERASDLAVTESLGRRMLGLPMAVDLSPDERRRICGVFHAGGAARPRALRALASD
jgi:dTDP-4-amino-4,6-dideoxygalactose transaminase